MKVTLIDAYEFVCSLQDERRQNEFMRLWDNWDYAAIRRRFPEFKGAMPKEAPNLTTEE